LVIETPRANLVEGMKWLLGSYTQRFNRQHGLWGHLFGGRYKALLVDGRLKTISPILTVNRVDEKANSVSPASLRPMRSRETLRPGDSREVRIGNPACRAASVPSKT
jgi:hypothetical protein